MKVRCFLVFVASAFLAVLPAAAQTAEQWVAKARAFLGSETDLNEVKSIHYTGSLEIQGKAALPAEIVFQKPYRQYITVKGPKIIETTALDGYDAWQKRTNVEKPSQWQVVLLDAGQVKRLRANTLENLSFYSAREMKGCVVELLGDATVDGVACKKISFTHTGGVVFIRYFDQSTGRLIKTETENGAEIREEGEMIVNGVRFPKRVINKAPNGTVTAITFDTVVLNELMPVEAFAVPSFQAK